MKTKIANYIYKHVSSIILIFDIIAFLSFVFAAITSFLVGNVSAVAAYCCAIIWVGVARIREQTNATYEFLYNSIKNAYNAIKAEYDELNAKYNAIMKEKANDNINSKN